MKIERSLLPALTQAIRKGGKVVMVFGSRQVGKTTLVRDALRATGLKTFFVNADEERHNAVLASRDLATMRRLVDGYEVLFVDEAQRIENVGLGLKILHDALPDLRIVVTGSSSLDLASKTRESLTGRTRTFHLYPLAFQELARGRSPAQLDDLLPQALVWGLYPGIFTQSGADRTQLLRELATSYLYRDVLEFEGVRHPRKIRDLLRLLAFQIGSEVSMNELANTLDLGVATVVRYVDLLEKSFVVFRLGALSRNLRKEVSKKDKIYFWDLGVRNALIDNLSELPLRADVGQLWENFLVVERIKKTSYLGRAPSRYFWRVYTGDEVDYIEEENGKLDGFEFKYSKTTARRPDGFLNSYPGATFSCVSRANWQEFAV